jgi:hypothetical protein
VTVQRTGQAAFASAVASLRRARCAACLAACRMPGRGTGEPHVALAIERDGKPSAFTHAQRRERAEDPAELLTHEQVCFRIGPGVAADCNHV